MVSLREMRNETTILTTVADVLALTEEKEVLVAQHSWRPGRTEGEVKEVPENGVLWFKHGNYSHVVIGTTVMTSTLTVT